jgi:hypothetical protein
MMKMQTRTWPAYRIATKPASSATVLMVRVLSERMRAESGCSASSSAGCVWPRKSRVGIAAARGAASRLLPRTPAGLPVRGLAPPPGCAASVEARPRVRFAAPPVGVALRMAARACAQAAAACAPREQPPRSRVHRLLRRVREPAADALEMPRAGELRDSRNRKCCLVLTWRHAPRC